MCSITPATRARAFLSDPVAELEPEPKSEPESELVSGGPDVSHDIDINLDRAVEELVDQAPVRRRGR